jgi:hypothetical protein
VLNFAASRGRMKVSAFGFVASRLSQGDQRGHDTGGFNPRDGAAYRSEQPALKADLGRAKAAPKGDGFLKQIRRRCPAVPASTILEDYRVFRRCGASAKAGPI